MYFVSIDSVITCVYLGRHNCAWTTINIPFLTDPVSLLRISLTVVPNPLASTALHPSSPFAMTTGGSDHIELLAAVILIQRRFRRKLAKRRSGEAGSSLGGLLPKMSSLPSLRPFRGFTAPKSTEEMHPGLRRALRARSVNECILALSLLAALGNLLLSASRLFSALCRRSPVSLHLSGTQVLGTAVFLALFGHRLLGYVLGLLIRGLLRRSFLGDNADQWRIHFGWVAYRGLLDRQQLVLHDVLWLNPTEYRETPFLLYVKELAISISIEDIFAMVRGRHDPSTLTVNIEEVMIDSLEVFIERNAGGGINLWSAMGVKAKSDVKNSGRFLQTFEKSIETFFWKLVQSLQAQAFKLNLDWTSKEPVPSQPFVTCDRILALNVKAHVLDLLSATHVPYKKSSAIKLPLWYMRKRQLLDSNAKPLRLNKFIDKAVENLSVVLLTANSVTIPSLLAHSAANKTTNAVSFAVSSVIPTSLDFGIDLDVYGRTKEWLSAQTAESKESEGATLDDQLDVTCSETLSAASQPNKKVSPSIEGDNNTSDHHSLNWVRKLYPF